MAPGTILYIDDEEINLSNFSMAFEDEFTILTALSGEEALKIFSEHPEITVVVADQRMPGMSGVELLSKIRKVNSEPIRIILTAYADSEDIIDAINLGQIYRYIKKPWDYEELRVTLLRAQDAFDMLRQNQELMTELEKRNSQLQADIEEIQRLETERREIEIKMLSQDKLASLGEIATGIAHEINQPLSYIKIFIQATRADLKENDLDLTELPEELSESLRQVGRISKIIDHLRVFGRASHEDFTNLYLPNVLDNAMILFSEKLRLNNINLVQKMEVEVPVIRGSSIQLEQVFINLLQNSIYALEGVGNAEITIAMEDRDGQLSVQFSDNGKGMPPEVQAKVFEPFFTTKAVGKGTGLGMSIIYGIIGDHNGTIECHSKEGNGTTFSMLFPAADSEPAE